MDVQGIQELEKVLAVSVKNLKSIVSNKKSLMADQKPKDPINLLIFELDKFETCLKENTLLEDGL